MAPFRDRLIVGNSALCAVVLLAACAAGPRRQSSSVELGERASRIPGFNCSILRLKLDSLDKAIAGIIDESMALSFDDELARSALVAEVHKFNDCIDLDLRRILEIDPRCELPYIRLGDQAAELLHYSDAQAEVAETYYRNGLRMRPDHPGLLARLAWMRELNGDVDSAITLYKQARVVQELGIDGVMEAARLQYRSGFAERFKTAGDKAYIDVITQPGPPYGVPDLVSTEKWFTRVYPSGRCEYNIPQFARDVFVSGGFDVPEHMLDSLLALLEQADVLRFRDILDPTTNQYICMDATHCPTTVINIHAPNLDHSVSVYALELSLEFERRGYRSRLALDNRFRSLARASKLLYARPWITSRLDSTYGTYRPLHSRDGLARCDPKSGIVTGIRVPDFGPEWRANIAALSEIGAGSRKPFYVFDIGTQVVALAGIGGSMVYRLHLSKEEWPHLVAPSHRDVMYFARIHDSDVIIQAHSAASGRLLFAGRVNVAGEAVLTHDEITMDRKEELSETDFLSRIAEEFRASGKGNRPAMEELDYEHW